MKGVELYGRVRRAIFVEGMSRREAACVFVPESLKNTNLWLMSLL